MKILFLIIFTLCLIPAGAVTTVTGYRGGSVQIRCNYTAGSETNTKYLCRGDCLTPPWEIKDIPVHSGSDPEDKRFSLHDNTTDKVFIITITDLRAEDENTYWCGIDQFVLDHYTRVDLLVKTAGADAETTVTGYRGGSVQIRCNYTAGYETNRKYLCRCSRFTPPWEINDIPVRSGSEPEDKRFSLYDNTADKVFIITIMELRPEDEDTYCCGIEHFKFNHLTRVDLRVKTDDPAKIPVPSSTHFPSTHAVSTSVPAESTPLTTGSTIILVLVIVALLLIGLVLLIVFLKKRRRKKHGVSPPCVSEGTEDTGRCSEAVYSNFQPPTCASSSYKNVFSMAQVDTVPCDSTHAAADMPSNSPDEDFCSTAQLPADPSASSEKPDEGPIYTQIMFNVTHHTDFKKEDHSCEYSTVAAVHVMSPK